MTILKPHNCHCVEPGGNYSPSFIYGTEINNCADGKCIDSVFADVYRLDFNYTSNTPGIRPCCPFYTQRFYNLYFRPTLSTGNLCVFTSNEKSKEWLNVVDCQNWDNVEHLAQFGIGANSSGFTFEVRILFHQDINPPDMTIEYSTNLGTINCLSTITLPLRVHASDITDFIFGTCFSGTLPTNVTLTPI